MPEKNNIVTESIVVRRNTIFDDMGFPISNPNVDEGYDRNGFPVSRFSVIELPENKF